MAEVHRYLCNNKMSHDYCDIIWLCQSNDIETSGPQRSLNLIHYMTESWTKSLKLHHNFRFIMDISHIVQEN